MVSVRGCHCDYEPWRKQNLVTPLRIHMRATTTTKKTDLLSYVVIFVEGKFWWRCHDTEGFYC
jgi:hypothetical protein